jgi:hypothetical protein
MSDARTLATSRDGAAFVEGTPARTQSRGPATSSDEGTGSARASSPMKIKCRGGFASTAKPNDPELTRLGEGALAPTGRDRGTTDATIAPLLAWRSVLRVASRPCRS